MTAHRRSTPRGWRAYAAREVAEVAVLVAVLAIVASFIRVPVWLLVGLPLAKALASAVYYVLFLRRAFRRPARLGADELIGRIARAETPLRPEGQIKLDGEIWSARSADGRTVGRHDDVEIVGVRGNTVLVSRADREG
jgi:membrane protein implicated in regulation of membrane protease activity